MDIALETAASRTRLCGTAKNSQQRACKVDIIYRYRLAFLYLNSKEKCLCSVFCVDCLFVCNGNAGEDIKNIWKRLIKWLIEDKENIVQVTSSQIRAMII